LVPPLYPVQGHEVACHVVARELEGEQVRALA
jgi:hypothetical protein